MTNPIGSDTCNFPLNITRAEREVWGKLFFQSGAKSMNEFLKGLLLSAATKEHPKAASEIQEIRKRREFATRTVYTIGAILIVSLQFLCPMDMRRAGRRAINLPVRFIRRAETTA